MLLGAKKRGQSATEYAIIVGIALMILIPLWLSINTSLNTTKTALQSSYAQHAVSKLKGAADAVYVQGSPAKFTLLISLPEGVQNVTIANNEISVRLSTASGISDVIGTTIGPVYGSISPEMGTHRVVVSASGGGVNITEG
jgi:hypothetical protein